VIPDEGRTIAYVFTAKRVGHGVKLSTFIEKIVASRIGLRVVSTVPNACASEMLERSRRIGRASYVYGIHSENVHALWSGKVVEVGVGRLCDDLF
jgi:hypothetical protein